MTAAISPATPTISVIVPAYIPAGPQGAACLAQLLRCVRSIAQYSIPQFVELLVQDDASPGVDSLAGTLPDYVAVERNAHNLGFAANCNAGAKRAKGAHLFVLNQDTICLGEWYAPLLTVFHEGAQTGQQVGLVGPKLLFPPAAAPPAGAAGDVLALQSCGGLYDAALQPFHRWLGYREDYPEANVCQEVSWITGAAHVWRRECWEAIRGYDEAYQGGYFEDVDACCRAQAAGYRVWYCPGARFLHHVATTSGGVRPEQFRQNAGLFWRRWVQPRRVSPDVPAIYERWWA